MKFSYRKDIFVFLIISGILSLLGAISIALEGAYPFIGGIDGLLYYILAVYFLAHSIISFIIALKLKTLDPMKTTRRLAIFQFSAIGPVFLLLALESLGIQRSYLEWVYYLNIGILSAICLFNSFLGLYISKKIISKEPGYVLVRSTSSMASTFSLAFLVLYASTPIKVFSIVGYDGFDPQRFIDNPFYFILTEIMALFLITVISLIMLFVGITCYLTSREGELVDFRHNLHFTLKTLKKYHIGFWFGIVFTTLLFVTSLVSAFSLFKAYISLAALYLALLLIRITTFIYERHLRKKYFDEPKKYFKEIHIEAIYTSIVLLLYIGVIIYFRITTTTNADNPPSIYLVLIFLAPLNVLRAITSSIRQHKYKGQGNPHILIRTLTDIVVALFAIINTLIILGTLFKNDIIINLGWVGCIIMLVISVAICVYMMIVGIIGVKNKRKVQLEHFIPYYEKEREEERKEKEKEQARRSLASSK